MFIQILQFPQFYGFCLYTIYHPSILYANHVFKRKEKFWKKRKKGKKRKETFEKMWQLTGQGHLTKRKLFAKCPYEKKKIKKKQCDQIWQKMILSLFTFRYGEKEIEHEQKKLTISTPRNDFQHRGHVGIKWVIRTDRTVRYIKMTYEIRAFLCIFFIFLSVPFCIMCIYCFWNSIFFCHTK